MTRTILLALVALFIIGQSSAQQNHRLDVNQSDIHLITVYLNGAEIKRQTNIELKAGKNLIVFKNLSAKLNPQSVRVSTNPDIDILSISTQNNYLDRQKEQPRIVVLRDSLKNAQQKITALENELEAYATEKKLLIDNMQLSGKQTAVAVSDLQQAAGFYRSKLKEINPIISNLKDEIVSERLLLNRLSNALKELNADKLYARKNVFLLVKSNIPQKAPFDLQYLVNDAGWAASYDIKATDLTQKIQFIYRAKVFNNTGIDWENTQLVLSLSDPSLSDSKPQMNPWYLNRNQGQHVSNMIQEDIGYQQNSVQTNDFFRGVSTEITSTDEFEEVFVNELNVDFKIQDKYSIPADDKPYLVDIATHNLDVSFKHFAVTKLDKDVFLLARITGWEELNLIEGPANVYFKGSYVGQSEIKTRNIKDTLDISLGRDNKVLVTRTKLANYSNKQFIGSKIKQTISYELVAKNNRKNEIQLEILDQIPVSQTDDIEVKIIEISGADYNQTTGKISWKMNLKPTETRKFKLTFEVKYPKEQIIHFNNSRTKMMRKF